IVCVGQHKQLALAWTLYAIDNVERFPGNPDGLAVRSPDATNNVWCAGWLNNEVATPDNTNSALITDAQVGKYAARSYQMYHCPSDVSKNQGTSGARRVRSYSANSYVGERI